jgi:hypothetical protein
VARNPKREETPARFLAGQGAKSVDYRLPNRRLAIGVAGTMFWFRWNRLAGSYASFTSASHSYVAAG